MSQLPLSRAAFGKSNVLPRLVNRAATIGRVAFNNVSGATALKLLIHAPPLPELAARLAPAAARRRDLAISADVGPDLLQPLFDARDSPGIQTLARQQRLSPDAADQRSTRIRALVARLLPPT